MGVGIRPAGSGLRKGGPARPLISPQNKGFCFLPYALEHGLDNFLWAVRFEGRAWTIILLFIIYIYINVH